VNGWAVDPKKALVSAAGSRFIPDLERLIGERHPDGSPAFLRASAQYLRERLTGLGLAVTMQPFPRADDVYENVIASASSSSGTGAPLIVAAHYDTVAGSPGADDNASALAVLLDVARQAMEHRPARPIHFIAFCLEEENLSGSRAYVARLAAAQDRIQGAIVLECVGYARHEEGTQKIPPGVPLPVPTVGNFLAVIGNQGSHALTETVEQAMRPYLPVVPLIVPGNGELLPDTRRSDHTSFWEAGCPAVMLTDTANFRNPHYHRPTDTFDTLNLPFMASVADAVTAAVLALARTTESV